MNRTDQLVLRFQIQTGRGQDITPGVCSDMIIKVGDYEKSYLGGDLEWNEALGVWEFPVTQEMSQALGSYAVHQEKAVFKADGKTTILSTPVRQFRIGDSVFGLYEEETE